VRRLMSVSNNPGGLGHQSAPSSRLLLLLAFATIYLVWGSTFLAIRFTVETIPPLLAAGLRHLIAGTTLFAWIWSRGFRPTRRDWYGSAVLGFFFFLLGHGTLHWAEQAVPSGLAALLVAAEPLWITLLSFATSYKQTLNFANISGLVIGFLGVVLLTTDKTLTGHSASIVGIVALILGTIAWAFGMLYSKRSTSLPSDALARSAMSLLIGSWMLLASAAISGELRGFHWSTVSGRSILGLFYLAIFGSIIAYSAYTWLLQRCSPTLIATHTYVNPVVAVFLGWALAGETLTRRMLLAAGLVIVSVICVSFGHSEARERIPGELDGEAA
ncbi:MAG TPA: EamA family transporter, partial [Terriglobales bacterium]|nr:EamA family transporter [Terriglobales bacterium]